MSDNNLVDNIIVAKLKEKFSDAVLEVKSFRDETTIIVNKESIVEMCKYLRDDNDLRFDYLSDLCGVDKIELNNTFEIVYHLYSLTNNNRVRLKAPISSDDEKPSISTVSSVWPTANWHEREVYDMFGVVFDGHPDLRRILTPDGFKGHPLRKDYPINKRQPENLREIFRKDFD
ncbi:MAG: NADH-quinone oxidoreductase subunit C [Candidatus Anammoxibacter sp.]